jgi:hypothetical protein
VLEVEGSRVGCRATLEDNMRIRVVVQRLYVNDEGPSLEEDSESVHM